MDLTFQRGMGIVEARIHSGQRCADRQAHRHPHQRAQSGRGCGTGRTGIATAQSRRSSRRKRSSENVVKPSEENGCHWMFRLSPVPGGTKFLLTVINSTDKLVPFPFRSGQTYDFEVVDASTGQEVWRWSRRMFFTQVVRQEALRPSRNWTFEVTWNHRDNDLNVVSAGSI